MTTSNKSNNTNINNINREACMKTLEQQREELIKQLYGTVTDEQMCSDRNYSTVAYEATLCGRQIEDVLTRYEVELLAKQDADYEVDECDLVPYERPPVGQYVREQITDLMRNVHCSEEVAQVVEESEYTVKPRFIDDVQKETNYSFYMRQLDTVQDRVGLTRICKTVIGAQKREGGNFFFPAGMSQVFWARYREVKADMNRLVIAEIEDFIEQATVPWKVKLYKKEIYQQRLGKEESKPLYELADKKIKELSA